VFTGTTEVRAVEALAALAGAEVRISYDVRRTRLHAKAWLFERSSELHTAYVGSANLATASLRITFGSSSSTSAITRRRTPTRR